MRILIAVIFLVIIAEPAHAGLEVELSRNQGDVVQAQIAVGYATDYAWGSAGLRQNHGPYAAIGPRMQLGAIDLRAGALVASHEAEHDFGGDYGTKDDGNYGYGGLAEIAVDLAPYQPFARYQVVTVTHSYNAVRQIGTDDDGNAVYGDPVSNSENNHVEELILGVRMSF